MTSATLPGPVQTKDRPLTTKRVGIASNAGTRPLLVLSKDDRFCRDLLSAATEKGMRLTQMPATTSAQLNLRILKPGAVLLDLDPQSEASWDTADLLAHDEDCPLLVLLTSPGDQLDFKLAVG